MATLEDLTQELENKRDDLLDAVKAFFEDSEDEISISRIQREFSVGYFRAGRIMRQISKGW